MTSLLHLVAVILEPDLDLSGAQTEHARHVLALGRTQILLRAEASLELARLLLGEEDASLALLARAARAARRHRRRRRGRRRRRRH